MSRLGKTETNYILIIFCYSAYMIRHTFLSLLFAILFVFAQQEAMLHPYAHTADWQQKSSEDKQAPKHSEVCGKCVALNNISHTVSTQTHSFHIASGQFELSTSPYLSIVSESFVPYHSRAPPYLA